jgi:effector-binding domain-containing protein
MESLPQIIGAGCAAIGAHLAEAGATPAGPLYVSYHNAGMRDLDVEMGFPVAGLLPGRGKVRFRVLPKCRVATCLFTGPYDQIGRAYEVLQAWMAAEGLAPAVQMYEWYLNSPDEVSPEALLTKIAWLIAGA